MGKIEELKEKAKGKAGGDRLSEILQSLARTNRRLGETLTIVRTLPSPPQSQIAPLKQSILCSLITGGILLMGIWGWLEIRNYPLQAKAASWDRMVEKYQQMTPETQIWVQQNLLQ